jgi:hypothetical protein
MDVVATGLWPVHLGISNGLGSTRVARVGFGALAESNFSSIRISAPRSTAWNTCLGVIAIANFSILTAVAHYFGSGNV